MSIVTVKHVPDITIVNPLTKKPIMREEEVDDLPSQADELKIKARTALDEGEFEKASSYCGALAGKKVVLKPWVVSQAKFYREVLAANKKLFTGFTAIAAAGAISDGLDDLEKGLDMDLADGDGKLLADALEHPKYWRFKVNEKGQAYDEVEVEGFPPQYDIQVLIQLRNFIYAGKREPLPENKSKVAKMAQAAAKIKEAVEAVAPAGRPTVNAPQPPDPPSAPAPEPKAGAQALAEGKPVCQECIEGAAQTGAAPAPEPSA